MFFLLINGVGLVPSIVFEKKIKSCIKLNNRKIIYYFNFYIHFFDLWYEVYLNSWSYYKNR